MNLTLAAIGKMKPSPEAELVRKYTRQMHGSITIKELEARKGLSGDALKSAEAELLLEATANCHRRIALDERGKHLSSECFAKQFSDWQNDGCSHIGLMIGGADGLDASVRQAADLVLSFGELTWPHMMVRAMACEQLYRAESILRGHPYHRA